MQRLRRSLWLAVLVALVALVAGPAASLEEPAKVNPNLLRHLSQVVQARQNADRARHAAAQRAGAPFGDRFNRDDVGLPQNEESVTVCKNAPQYAIEGANDYRGLLDPQGNSSGYYFSTNGGRSVAKEGLLPPLTIQGQLAPSGGDPVLQSDPHCNIFYADLNYPADNPMSGFNGIGLYKTTPRTLASCPPGQDPTSLTQPACWPTRKVVAFAHSAPLPNGTFRPGSHFLDKPWMDVGQSGKAGEVVWVTWSDFNEAPTPTNPAGFTAQIKAARCDANLTSCTAPILISGGDLDIQFSDVTIAQDGSTLITWVSIQGELEQTAQTFTVKARVAPPGSTNFGPTRTVAVESNPLPFGGFLHANDFRIATYPKSIMPFVGGKPRLFVTWDRCRFRLLDSVCEESEILLSHSDDLGKTWSKPATISAGGDNYFPAISDEVGSPNFTIAYYTNRFDPIFHNRQDVELVTIGAASGQVVKRQRVTKTSNETEADPLLGGFFIGDYIDVHLLGGVAYVGYNANERHIRVLGQGFPIPQQDNYLTKLPS